MVKEDYIIFLFSDEVETFVAALRREYLYLSLLEQTFDNGEIHYSIINNEYLCTRCREFFVVGFTLRQVVPVSFFKITHRLPIHNLLLNGEREVGALTVNTVNFKFGAHKPQELLSDIHSETCAFNIAIALFLNPLKCTEELGYVLLLDTNSRIFDAEFEQYAVLSGNFITKHQPD